MSVTDVGLNMETPRLLQLAARIATCLVEVVLRDPVKSQDFVLVKNTLLLSQSLNCGLWEDSEYVSKQMLKVGVVLSNAIASAGFKDLSSLSEANPRMLCWSLPPRNLHLLATTSVTGPKLSPGTTSRSL